MSALAALLRQDGGSADARAAGRMLEAMRRRGPDAREVWQSEEVCLGVGLLATTPEDELGPHPFRSADGAVVVALDGRIDNRAEVARGAGVEERGATDAELAAAAYARWGDGFGRRLIGDFAILVWDARRRALVATRDPMGARPLYHAVWGGALRCASSPRALFAGAERAPGPSFEAMALLLAERYVERRDALLEGVSALPPGAVMLATSGSIETSKPWWPGPVEPLRLRDRREHVERFRAALEEAVRARLRARGPVAAHVSGGVDSSSIASLATHVARGQGSGAPLLVRCVFPDLECDESPFSDAVAAHLGLPILSVVMPGALEELAPDPERVPVDALYHPVSFMLTRMIDAALERRARVTLTGAGSDQLLQPTGHEAIDALLRGDVRRALSLSGAAAAPLSLAPYARLLRGAARRAAPGRVLRAARALRGRGDDLPSWMTERARRAVRDAEEGLGAPSRGGPDLSARWLAWALHGHPDYSYGLALADQIAASRGADLRHPFFDRRLIDLLLSYPDEEREAGPPDKALLRRAMGDDLPAVVRERSSAAEFSPLMKRVLVDAHGGRVEALLRGRLAEAGLVDPNAAAALVERARAGAPVLRELAHLTSLEVWLRQAAP